MTSRRRPSRSACSGLPAIRRTERASEAMGASELLISWREGADGPLPDVHLLAPQLRGQALDQGQVVPPAVELEGAAGDVEDLLLAPLLRARTASRGRSPAPRAAASGHSSRIWAKTRPSSRPRVTNSSRAARLAKIMRSRASVSDDGGGRRLEDGLAAASRAGRWRCRSSRSTSPDGVVELHQLAQLVPAVGGEIEAEVVVAVSLDAVAQRLEDAGGRDQHPVEHPPPQGQPETEGGEEHGPGGWEPVRRRDAEPDHGGEAGEEGEPDAAREAERLHPRSRRSTESPSLSSLR